MKSKNGKIVAVPITVILLLIAAVSVYAMGMHGSGGDEGPTAPAMHANTHNCPMMGGGSHMRVQGGAGAGMGNMSDRNHGMMGNHMDNGGHMGDRTDTGDHANSHIGEHMTTRIPAN